MNDNNTIHLHPVSEHRTEWMYHGFKTEEEANSWLEEVKKLYPNGRSRTQQMVTGIWLAAYLPEEKEEEE